jgi:hypothetical protein
LAGGISLARRPPATSIIASDQSEQLDKLLFLFGNSLDYSFYKFSIISQLISTPLVQSQCYTDRKFMFVGQVKNAGAAPSARL